MISTRYLDWRSKPLNFQKNQIPLLLKVLFRERLGENKYFSKFIGANLLFFIYNLFRKFDLPATSLSQFSSIDAFLVALFLRDLI